MCVVYVMLCTICVKKVEKLSICTTGFWFKRSMYLYLSTVIGLLTDKMSESSQQILNIRTVTSIG